MQMERGIAWFRIRAPLKIGIGWVIGPSGESDLYHGLMDLRVRACFGVLVVTHRAAMVHQLAAQTLTLRIVFRLSSH